jgi:hypothetical protein
MKSHEFIRFFGVQVGQQAEDPPNGLEADPSRGKIPETP